MSANEIAITMLRTDEIYPHPLNPRQDLGDLTELTESIRQSGVMQNLTVIRGRYVNNRDMVIEAYTVVIGHRRLAAAKAAGLEKVPCVVADMDVKTQVATMLLENLHRNRLTYYEEAHGVQLMMKLGSNVHEIADMTGLSETSVRRRVKMAELDPQKLQKASERQITMDEWDQLATIYDVKERNKLLEIIGTVSFRYKLDEAKAHQKYTERITIIEDALNEKGLIRLNTPNEVNGKCYVDTFNVLNYDMVSTIIVKPGARYYRVNDAAYLISLYGDSDKQQESKRDNKYAAEIAQAWELVDNMDKLCKTARDKFISSAKIPTCDIIAGILIAAECNNINFIIDKEFIAHIRECPPIGYPKMVQMLFSDEYLSDSYETAHTAVRKYKPHFIGSEILAQEYVWLESVGYVMSEEEKQMLDGTHPAYKGRDEIDA